MKIRITNSRFDRVGTVVSAPAGADIGIDGGQFRDVGMVVELRDPQSVLAYLGLGPDTPPDAVRSVLQFLASGFSDPPSVQAKAESLGFSRWLSIGADMTTLVSNLISLSSPETLQKVLGIFGG